MASLFVLSLCCCRQTKHSECKSQFAVTSCQWNFKCAFYTSEAHTSRCEIVSDSTHIGTIFLNLHFFPLFMCCIHLPRTSFPIIRSLVGGLLLPCTYPCVCTQWERKKGNFNSSLNDDKKLSYQTNIVMLSLLSYLGFSIQTSRFLKKI